MSKEGLEEYNSKIELFSQAIEAPYVILNEPDVVVIGTGGGRDIFMAKTHKAKTVIGAEINPATYYALSENGLLYDYSGGIYSLDGVKVYNVDGRHLVKRLKPDSFDLIMINGADTLSGLSSGAYTYAESYLYTKNAIIDYLRILKKDGIINFDRWLYYPYPRETLRLLAISLDALRSFGLERPWEHVIIGDTNYGWAITLIKKSPFSNEERSAIKKYFKDKGVFLLFPTENWENKRYGTNITFFDGYAQAFTEGLENNFVRLYPYDISVVTDDKPFFYKYYKLNSFNPFKIFGNRYTGTIVFMTQFLVLIQTGCFILLFIILPLIIFKIRGIKNLGARLLVPFIIYFSCLGVGFMFVEIPIMQHFVLLLGSPIYSISVTLSALLIFSGIGSLIGGYLNSVRAVKADFIVTVSLILLFVSIMVNVFIGGHVTNYFMRFSFLSRTVVSAIMLLPVGLSLGTFFPLGLGLIGKRDNEVIAWAWGINCGFTVLGSILSIILGQYIGFNAVMIIAVTIYLAAVLAFCRMKQAMS